MTDSLLIGITGLNAQRQALNVTSHNIANANTEGYHRQRVDLTAANPEFRGGMAFGNGVEVERVRRILDETLEAQIRDSSASYERANALNGPYEQLGNLLNDASSGFQATTGRFFDAAQDLASDPASQAAREVFFHAARDVSDRLSSLGGRLQAMQESATDHLSAEIGDANIDIQRLVQANRDIQQAEGTSPDLEDRRDLLVQKITDKIGGNVYLEDDGQARIYTDKGLNIVNGINSVTLGLERTGVNDFDVVMRGSPSDTVITDSFSTGSISGYIDAAGGVIDGATNRLGRLATAFADTVNQQHQLGLDAGGNPGVAMFDLSDPTVKVGDDNTGSATAVASMTDSGALDALTYDLTYDGGSGEWNVRDSNNQAVGSFAGSTLSFDGLQVDVTGTPADGDTLHVDAIRGALTGGLTFNLTDANQIAARAPVVGTASNQNQGQGILVDVNVTDMNHANLSDPITIKFQDPPTSFDLVDDSGATVSAGVAYTPGEAINFNGWSAVVDGHPEANDTFLIEGNQNGAGDNRNILSIANINDQKIIDDASRTTTSEYNAILANIGSAGAVNKDRIDSEQLVLNAAIDRRDAMSGVNLDEEAANLIRQQQAYQASAQVIAISRSLFDTLIQAV